MNENAASDASLVGKPIDLTNCDREPIHIPGSIQPHGCLLGCDNAGRVVLYHSDNAAALLNLAQAPLDQPLTEVLGSENVHRLLNALAVSGRSPRPSLIFGMTVNGRTLDATIHRFKGRTIIEFEPASERLGTIISLSRTVIERLRATDGTDRLIAQGLPQDFIDIANDKLAAINAAHDRIRKERGAVMETA